jgi:hypothetical protein
MVRIDIYIYPLRSIKGVISRGETWELVILVDTLFSVVIIMYIDYYYFYTALPPPRYCTFHYYYYFYTSSLPTFLFPFNFPCSPDSPLGLSLFPVTIPLPKPLRSYFPSLSPSAPAQFPPTCRYINTKREHPQFKSAPPQLCNIAHNQIDCGVAE